MAKLFRRGKAWYITYYQAGKRHRKSLGKDRKQAMVKFREITYRLSRKELIESSKIPIGMYREEFLEYVKARNSRKTHHNYSLVFKQLENYLKEEEGVKYISGVERGMIDRYISFRLKSPSMRRKGCKVERSTVNMELKVIKRIFNRALELNYLKENPASKVKLLSTARKNPRFFSEEEVFLILDDCKDIWAKEIYVALLYTGMRIGELANLEWKDLDLDSRKIMIRHKDFWKPKGNTERMIPMHGVVFCMLVNKERESRWVFTKADGEKINVHSLETKFRRQLKRLGIPYATLHTWRHTFASYIVMRSGNIRAVQKLLGHRSIKTTEIYSHLSSRHLHSVVSMLPGPNLGTVLGTPASFEGSNFTQVVDNKVVGDAGLEPATSTV
ncbi:MAG: tyrosine-type recombinase/integrase [Acidobacteriota bacterium]